MVFAFAGSVQSQINDLCKALAGHLCARWNAASPKFCDIPWTLDSNLSGAGFSFGKLYLAAPVGGKDKLLHVCPEQKLTEDMKEAQEKMHQIHMVRFPSSQQENALTIG